jgi:hypothetical protein
MANCKNISVINESNITYYAWLRYEKVNSVKGKQPRGLNGGEWLILRGKIRFEPPHGTSPYP